MCSRSGETFRAPAPALAMEGTEMTGRREETLAVLAAILGLFAAMLNPSVTLAIALLLLALGLLLVRRRRV
jgi:hypothetical protein